MNALTHTRTFRVRNYECDAYGHMNSVNYLRFMQEAAFDATAAAGYGMQHYMEVGQFWLARESQVKFLRPVKYDQSVSIKTWIVDTRRFRSKRRYEFRLEGEEELAAEAHTDWVYVDGETGRPTHIPDELIKAFFADGEPAGAMPRDRFPKAPPAPDGAVIYLHRVAWRDLDEMRHVNNANYLAFLEDAGAEALRQYGWPLSRSLENGHGWAARDMRIEYKAQPRLGDELEITTYLSDMKRIGCRRWYFVRIKGSQALAAQAYVDWIFIDVESGWPVRVPEGLATDLASNIV